MAILISKRFWWHNLLFGRRIAAGPGGIGNGTICIVIIRLLLLISIVLSSFFLLFQLFSYLFDGICNWICKRLNVLDAIVCLI